MNILQVVVGAVVVVEKRLNEDAADVAVVGANENVLAVAGFETAKPNDEPVDAVLAAGNNEVLPPPEKKINLTIIKVVLFFESEYTKTKCWGSRCCCCCCRRLTTSE